jgi:nicotinate phosphoribosyltransferase
MKSFYIASEHEIKKGRTTDVYYERTKKILDAKGKKKVKVVAEVTTGGLPDEGKWGILCGVEEVARLFEGRPVDIDTMPEGSLFRPTDVNGVRVPVAVIDGTYFDFCELETPLLGFLCQESGVATRAAIVRIAAQDKPAVAFGARRAHPALAPALDRAAYIGGIDGVSTILGAEVIGEEPMGTMPHSLIIIFGDQAEAWRAFDEELPIEVPRVTLVDTYWDEKIEAVRAAEVLGTKLSAVRLDTPSSRRGDFSSIINEVRWELDIRGYTDVGIFVSGGLNAEAVTKLREAGADGFGVGTWVSCAPPIDFAMDIVEVEGEFAAKRGKLGGKKQVWRCSECLQDTVQLIGNSIPQCSRCGNETEAMLKPLIRNGKIVGNLPLPKEIRQYSLEQLKKFEFIH